MPNQTYANEWLEKARRHLETAELLFREDHYTDIIAIEIHQSIEKLFKSVYAYLGISIPKTHRLESLIEITHSNIQLDISIEEIIIISDYYQTERYPGPNYSLPSRTEIHSHLEACRNTFRQVSDFINKV